MKKKKGKKRKRKRKKHKWIKNESKAKWKQNKNKTRIRKRGEGTYTVRWSGGPPMFSQASSAGWAAEVFLYKGQGRGSVSRKWCQGGELTLTWFSAPWLSYSPLPYLLSLPSSLPAVVWWRRWACSFLMGPLCQQTMWCTYESLGLPELSWQT